eukprot:3483338-Rhodomonas_salina.1
MKKPVMTTLAPVESVRGRAPRRTEASRPAKDDAAPRGQLLRRSKLGLSVLRVALPVLQLLGRKLSRKLKPAAGVLQVLAVVTDLRLKSVECLHQRLRAPRRDVAYSKEGRRQGLLDERRRLLALVAVLDAAVPKEYPRGYLPGGVLRYKLLRHWVHSVKSVGNKIRGCQYPMQRKRLFSGRWGPVLGRHNVRPRVRWEYPLRGVEEGNVLELRLDHVGSATSTR